MLKMLGRYQKGKTIFKVIKMFHGEYVVQVLGSEQTQRIKADVVEKMLETGEIKLVE